MNDSRHESATLATTDDHRIDVDLYLPTAAPSHVIQVFHGLGEHAARYARFADAATAAGMALVIHNHRGHGPSPKRRGFFAHNGGWQALVDDALVVQEFARERFPDVPIVLLGHSMGSFIAQSFAMHHGGRLRGLILSGSNWPKRLEVIPGWTVAHIVALFKRRTGHSPLLDKLGFGSFNRKFEPARTEMDWLSRDDTEVDKYVADALCGGPYTVGLWLDLLGGLLQISSDHALSRVPGDLPLLITGGADDPVGGEDGLSSLAMHYAQTGHSRMKLRIYPDGRHEMLNETNRDQVTGDILDWIGRAVRPAAAPPTTSDSLRSG